MSVLTRTADSCSPPLRGGGRWGIEKTAPAWIFQPFLAELGPSDKSPGAAGARAVSRLTCFPTGQLVHGIFQVAPVLTQISENWIAPPKGLSVKYEKKFKRPDPPYFFILIPKDPTGESSRIALRSSLSLLYLENIWRKLSSLGFGTLGSRMPLCKMGWRPLHAAPLDARPARMLAEPEARSQPPRDSAWTGTGFVLSVFILLSF